MSGLSPGTNIETKCVVCVDDDADILKLRRLLLEASGYSVVTATSGQQVLRILSGRPMVDVVLLDYLMPEMNGHELAQKLRQDYPELPLVAVSAVPELPDSMLELLDATVQKGSDPEILLTTLEQILAESAKKHPETRLQKATILCVEDECMQLKMHRTLFESAGYRVLEAQSTKQAFEIFTSSHVDAVVTDYWLSDSDGNGTALAEQMKRLRPNTPILMLSGFSALPGENTIVDLWLSKNQIEPQDLVAEVKRLIEPCTSKSGHPLE
jgi:CheY-like chemotaxis protein